MKFRNQKKLGANRLEYMCVFQLQQNKLELFQTYILRWFKIYRYYFITDYSILSVYWMKIRKDVLDTLFHYLCVFREATKKVPQLMVRQ